jgi:hypothetical protein
MSDVTCNEISLDRMKKKILYLIVINKKNNDKYKKMYT